MGSIVVRNKERGKRERAYEDGKIETEPGRGRHRDVPPPQRVEQARPVTASAPIVCPTTEAQKTRWPQMKVKYDDVDVVVLLL